MAALAPAIIKAFLLAGMYNVPCLIIHYHLNTYVGRVELFLYNLFLALCVSNYGWDNRNFYVEDNI